MKNASKHNFIEINSEEWREYIFPTSEGRFVKRRIDNPTHSWPGGCGYSAA